MTKKTKKDETRAKETKKVTHTYQFEGRVRTVEYMLAVKTRCGTRSRFEQVDPNQSGEEGMLADLHNPTNSLHSIESIQLNFERRRKSEGHRYASVTPHVVHTFSPIPH